MHFRFVPYLDRVDISQKNLLIVFYEALRPISWKSYHKYIVSVPTSPIIYDRTLGTRGSEIIDYLRFVYIVYIMICLQRSLFILCRIYYKLTACETQKCVIYGAICITRVERKECPFIVFILDKYTNR